jgi:hypothetical protein
MFAHRKYTLVVADAYNDDSDAASSPSMTPCPSPGPSPSVHSPALLLNRRRLPRPPPPPTAGDTTGLPPVLFSSLSASILQDRRQAATGAAAVAAGPLSSSSSLVSAAAANNERAALERTVRQRISGRRQRHPAGDRSGVADRDPTPPLMQPLVVDPAALLEEDRFLAAAVPGGGNCGEEGKEAAVPGGRNGGDEAPLRPWGLGRGDRRLGQRLEVMSRAAAERRPKAVDGGSPLVQGLKDFFSKMFAGR